MGAYLYWFASRWRRVNSRNTFCHLVPGFVMDLKRDKQSREKTLTQLERDDWGDCKSESEIIQRLFKLRHKPLKLIELSDLRTAIHFGVGMDYVLPIALDLLWSDPWLSSGNYAGDLLEAILRASPDFYLANQNYHRKVVGVAVDAVRVWEAMDAEGRESSGVDEVSIRRLLKTLAELEAIS